ncbi:MAG: MBL fold metallo-hydrolase [Rhodospirillaceae bacterium]|nr:MAG: MBL fold metallo-hydrolase [Rhodospirillaceae bacterium]
MAVTVTFHGACGIVTGSCFEVRTSRGAVLVDCGMFQGTKTIKSLNYGPFPFDPRSIGALVLTHAHIDHCGLVPKLIRAGFAGPVVATPETADLLAYVLPDSGHIQELEVERLNRRNRQRGYDQVDPIYTREDAELSLRHVTPRPYGAWIELVAGIRIRFWNAAHILGSASVEMMVSDKGESSDPAAMRLLFSGDIGPGEKPFQGAPEAPNGVDYLFAESTYGDRLRPRRTQEQRRTILRNEVRAGLKAGGMVLIPAFAVERTQELLVDLDALIDAGELPPTPIFVDSPLATRATEVFAKHLRSKISPSSNEGPAHAFERANLHFVGTVDESRKLDRLQGGGIIMAGSGMCDAGRIRHHLKNYLSHPNATILLVGYQAPGTLGRLLVDDTPIVRIQGDEIAVTARVRMLDEYSGHADQKGLVDWVRARLPVAQTLFLVHGEVAARETLAQKLVAVGIAKSTLHMPEMGETVRLTAQGARTVKVRPRVDVETVATADWHNRYAETMLRLRKHLEHLPNDRERQKLLQRVQGTLTRRR